MTESESPEQQPQEGGEEKTDREEGGPTSPESPQGEPEGAPGTKPTPGGLEPHE